MTKEKVDDQKKKVQRSDNSEYLISNGLINFLVSMGVD